MWRAGCISQDTYLLYTKWRKGWIGMLWQRQFPLRIIWCFKQENCWDFEWEAFNVILFGKFPYEEECRFDSPYLWISMHPVCFQNWVILCQNRMPEFELITISFLRRLKYLDIKLSESLMVGNFIRGSWKVLNRSRSWNTSIFCE